MNVISFDRKLIHFFRKISEPLARGGLFIVFFWFGMLKVVGMSPASPLVEALFQKTIPIVPFPTFLVAFGIFEMLIGIFFLIRGWERIVIPMLFLHMIATFMPLFLVPAATWSGLLAPSMEGQYIIKNLVIIAVAIGVAAHIHPLPKRVS